MTAQEGITAMQSEKDTIISDFSCTYNDMVARYDRERERLLSLSKEELVEMIIGKREHIGMIFG